MARHYLDTGNFQAPVKNTRRHHEGISINKNRTQVSNLGHDHNQKPNHYKDKNNYKNSDNYNSKYNYKEQDNSRKRKHSSDNDSYYINKFGNRIYKRTRTDYKRPCRVCKHY